MVDKFFLHLIASVKLFQIIAHLEKKNKGTITKETRLNRGAYESAEIYEQQKKQVGHLKQYTAAVRRRSVVYAPNYSITARKTVEPASHCPQNN